MMLTPPLTPPDCDLRDFRFMPLDVVRFTHSDLVGTADPEAVLAAIRLWCASWHQVPAASLTDDDRVLSQLAGYGRAVKAWEAVKPEALRGFVKCSDGRLYHPVVAEKAREAFKGKLQQRHRTFTATIRKHNERNPHDRRQAPSFDEWLEAGRPDSVTRDSARPEARQDELDLGTRPERARAPTGAETVPTGKQRDKGGSSRVTDDDVTRDIDESHADVTRETPSKGQGEGQGEGQGDSYPNRLDSPKPPLPDIAQRLADLAGLALRTDRARANAEAQVQAWIDAGIDIDATAVPAIQRVIAKRSDPTRSLKRFDDDVRHAHAQRRTKASAGSGTATKQQPVGPDDDDPRIAELRQRLKRKCGARTYDGWIAPAQFTINGVGVVATLPSRFLADWLQQHFETEIATMAHSLGLGSLKITTP